jgi:hypothetical protein
MNGENWLLLLHQIPPKPAYFRAQVLRRLCQAGALPVKNSAYLLPANDETLEDFQWICREIVDQGGQAWLFRSQVVAGFTADDIRAAFRQQRANDYLALIEECDALLAREELSGLAADYGRIVRRAADVQRIDFFAAPQRTDLEAIMSKIDLRLHGGDVGDPGAASAGQTGRTWITRRGVKVDRIGSAWLIKRFIDPEATFRFVDAANYTLNPGELRFDMFEGEFTHEGDLCTFEVLLRANHLADPALHALAEIIHDIDLKEARYQRPETPGLTRVIDGLCRQISDDTQRLHEGGALFESLYRSFSVE